MQVELTYNSSLMEGSGLTHDQPRLIFEASTIGSEGESVRVDNVIEASNHFRCVDYIIGHAGDALSEALLRRRRISV